MRAIMLCTILVCSFLSATSLAQWLSPEELRLHQSEIEQEEIELRRQKEIRLEVAQLRQDALKLSNKKTEQLLRDGAVYLCARDLTRDMFMRVGEKMVTNQAEFYRLVQADRDGAKDVLNQFFLSASEPLAKIIHGFLVVNDENEMDLIRACRGE